MFEQLRRQHQVPRQACEFRHLCEERDIAIRERTDDVFRLQPGQPGHAVRPGMKPVPAHGEVMQVGVGQSRDSKLRDLPLLQRLARLYRIT